MEQRIRELFKQTRLDRDLNQTDVALAGGVEQSAISKIEIEPAYEPSYTVFIKAVRGLGVKPADFIAHLEGDSSQPPAPKAVPDDSSGSPSLRPFPSDQEFFEALLLWAGRRFVPDAGTGRTQKLDAYRRFIAATRTEAPERPPRPGAVSRRRARRKSSKRRSGKR